MNNIIGIIFSFILILGIIGLSTLFMKRGILSNEGSRKFIHIGVCNWWIIAMIFFENLYYAIVVPVAFIIFNYLSYKYQYVKGMERSSSKNDLGTVYYPISLLLLVILAYTDYSSMYIGALGVFIMGYGDGFAAVLGKKYGRNTFKIMGNTKSLEGSLSMFVCSFIAASIILSIFHNGPAPIIAIALILAGFATIVEMITPFGLDNLTVPLLTSGLYMFFL